MRSVNTCDVIQLPYRNRVFNNTSPRFRVHLTPHPDSSVTVNELLPVLSWCCLTHVVNLLIDSKVLNYFQYQIRGSKTQKGVKKVLCSYYFDIPALVKYHHQWNAPNKDKNHQNKKKNTITRWFCILTILWITCLGYPGFSHFLKRYGQLPDAYYSKI